MAAKRKFESNHPEYRRLMAKADQQWDLAGLAAHDGDKQAVQQHVSNARKLEEQAWACLGAERAQQLLKETSNA